MSVGIEFPRSDVISYNFATAFSSWLEANSSSSSLLLAILSTLILFLKSMATKVWASSLDKKSLFFTGLSLIC